jgi:hypothetical protein
MKASRFREGNAPNIMKRENYYSFLFDFAHPLSFSCQTGHGGVSVDFLYTEQSSVDQVV